MLSMADLIQPPLVIEFWRTLKVNRLPFSDARRVTKALSFNYVRQLSLVANYIQTVPGVEILLSLLYALGYARFSSLRAGLYALFTRL